MLAAYVAVNNFCYVILMAVRVIFNARMPPKIVRKTKQATIAKKTTMTTTTTTTMMMMAAAVVIQLFHIVVVRLRVIN